VWAGCNDPRPDSGPLRRKADWSVAGTERPGRDPGRSVSDTRGAPVIAGDGRNVPFGVRCGEHDTLSGCNGQDALSGRSLRNGSKRIAGSAGGKAAALIAGAATASHAVLPAHPDGRSALQAIVNDELSADWFLLAA